MPFAVTPTLNVTSGIKEYVPSSNEPLGGLEITCAANPEFIGKFYDELAREGDELSMLLMKAQEHTLKINSGITWDEELKYENRFNLPGLISRAGNDFTINAGVLQGLNLPNFNNCNSTEDLFYDFVETTKIKIVDQNGVEVHGYVTAISNDRKTATIIASDGSDWGALETDNLTLLPQGTESLKGDCGNCFRTSYDPATYYNNSIKSDTCIPVDEDDWSDKGSVYREATTGGVYRYVEDMDRMLKKHHCDIYKKLMFDTPVDESSPAYTEGYRGFEGIIPQIEKRGHGWQGLINTKDDLYEIAEMLRRFKAPNMHHIDATADQYKVLQDMPFTDAQLNVDTEAFNRSCGVDDGTFFNYNVCGIAVNGHTFYYRRWDLTEYTQYEAESFQDVYHFLMTPVQLNKITFSNGKTFNQSHIHIVWDGNEMQNNKLKRKTNKDGTTCEQYEIRYISKYTVAVAMAHHMVIGKAGF